MRGCYFILTVIGGFKTKEILHTYVYVNLCMCMHTMCFGTHGGKKVSDLELELQVVVRLPNGACFLF